MPRCMLHLPSENVPFPLRWLPKASFIKHSFEGLCVNEFSGQQFDADANGGGMRDGKAVRRGRGGAGC